MAVKTKITTKRALITSTVVDLGDIIINSVVAFLTGSMVMLAEMLQGVADLSVDMMLLLGYFRSRKRPNRSHPFGFGKELYFWAVMSGVFIFLVTATLSIYFGIRQIVSPDTLENLYLAYAALGIGLVTNGYSFSISCRRLLNGRPLRSIVKLFFQSSQAAAKTTFISDLMGSLAAVTGMAALFIYGLTGSLVYDGAGAVAIGFILGILALVLLFGLRDLVTGRSASPVLELRIREAVESHAEVTRVLDLKTMVIGPDKLLVNIEVHLRDGLETDEIEKIMDEIKANVKSRVSQVSHIQVELETPGKT